MSAVNTEPKIGHGHNTVLNGTDHTAAGYNGGVNANRATPGNNILDNSQPAFPTSHRRFANPAPLGLSAFATTTLVLSLYNVNARHVHIPQVIVGLALAYGGLCQLLAGMWEFASGNTFAATAFSSYGGFWISYAIILSPWSNSLGAYGNDAGQLHNALGFFLVGWFIFTFIMFIASLRSSVGLASLFFFLSITFVLLFSAEFTGHHKVQVAGGAFGIITAFIAYYVALANLLTSDTSYFMLPVGSLARKNV